MFEDDRRRREAAFATALAVARRLGDVNLEVSTLAYLGASLVHDDRYEEGMILLDEALAAVAGSEVDDFVVLEEVFCQLFSACEHAHDVTRADQWIRIGEAIAARRRLPAVSAFCRTHYGGVLTAAGRRPTPPSPRPCGCGVSASEYDGKPILQWSAYTYWSDLPTDGMETIIRPHRGWAAMPTNDGLTMLVVGWPAAESHAYRTDIEANYLATLELVPEFAERVRAATRAERFTFAGVPNFYRRPFGPGWALVGDAGYCKDPITAQGISDAFHDAELCSTALDRAFRGELSFDESMSAYQRARDLRTLPIYGFTTELATLEPPPVEVQRLLGAAYGNQDAMDDFVSVIAGTVSPVDFFDPGNIAHIMTAANAAA